MVQRLRRSRCGGSQANATAMIIKGIKIHRLDGSSRWPAGLSIDGTPERARLREELAIALTPDLGEPFKREASGFADPCAKNDFVAERGGCLVIDFVAQHDPTDHLLRFGTGDCSPVGGGDILHPAQVNGVVDVILLVDV